jgi:hypothetical protein
MKKAHAALMGCIVLTVSLSACVVQSPGVPETVTVVPSPPASSEVETDSSAPAATPVTPSSEKTVLINGKMYDCVQVIASEVDPCTDSFRYAFDLWGENLERYINSGQLGPLGNGDSPLLPQDQIALLGLLACGMQAQNSTQTEFLEIASQLPKVERVAAITKGSEELLSFWVEAPDSLCPDLPSA